VIKVKNSMIKNEIKNDKNRKHAKKHKNQEKYLKSLII